MGWREAATKDRQFCTRRDKMIVSSPPAIGHLGYPLGGSFLRWVIAAPFIPPRCLNLGLRDNSKNFIQLSLSLFVSRLKRRSLISRGVSSKFSIVVDSRAGGIPRRGRNAQNKQEIPNSSVNASSSNGSPGA